MSYLLSNLLIDTDKFDGQVTTLKMLLLLGHIAIRSHHTSLQFAEVVVPPNLRTAWWQQSSARSDSRQTEFCSGPARPALDKIGRPNKWNCLQGAMHYYAALNIGCSNYKHGSGV